MSQDSREIIASMQQRRSAAETAVGLRSLPAARRPQPRGSPGAIDRMQRLGRMVDSTSTVHPARERGVR
jgi:hypothetical protein